MARIVSKLEGTLVIKLLKSSAALAAVLAISAPAQAVVYWSGYTTANSPSGFTPDVTFSAPGGTHFYITVEDCCVGGDYYATYVDGFYRGTTPYETPYGTLNSSATFYGNFSAGGTHDFELADLWTGFLPAGVYVEVGSAAPEPAAWGLMLVGVSLMGAALRSRKARLQL